MSALTIEEAVAQLQLVDHDFYMYRSAETGEVNVVYRRNHGGFGVIQPRPTSSEKNGNNSGAKVAATIETI